MSEILTAKQITLDFINGLDTATFVSTESEIAFLKEVLREDNSWSGKQIGLMIEQRIQKLEGEENVSNKRTN